MTLSTPTRTIQSMFVFVEIALPSAEMRRELENPKRRAAPMSMKPEENAPSTKYFSAASKDSWRRRRAVAAMMYRGRDMTSRATKRVTKLSAAGKIIMPPVEKSTRANISERW